MKVLLFGDVDLQLPEDTETIQGDIHTFEEVEDEYDAIHCINALAELDRRDALPFLKKLLKAVKPMGEVYIYVPNAEYACKQIFKNAITMTPFLMLYGTSDHPHKSCFTMLALRSLMEAAGLVVRSAYDGFYTMKSTEQILKIPQHIAMGVKYV